MTTPAYNIGAAKTLTGTFTDADGVLTDPSAITLTIREPDGVLVTKAIGDLTAVSTGVFSYDHTITKAGPRVVMRR